MYYLCSGEREGRKGCSPVFDWADRQQCEGGKSGLVSSDQTIIKLWPGRARDGSDKKIQIFPHQSQSQDRHKLLIRVQPCPGPSLYFTTD